MVRGVSDGTIGVGAAMIQLRGRRRATNFGLHETCTALSAQGAQT